MSVSLSKINGDQSLPRAATRVLMGVALVAAGVAHMTVARDEFVPHAHFPYTGL